MYCENIVTVFLNFNYSLFYVSLILFYFFIHISFFFFPSHMYPYFFFFISYFSLFPYHFLHTRALTFFLFFLSLAFFATTSPSRTFHTVSAPLSSLKVFAFFFSFFVLFLTIRKLQGREKMLMKKKKMKMIET